MSEQLLHEPRNPELERAGSLVSVENGNAKRDLRFLRAYNVAGLAAVLDLEIGRVHIGNGGAVLIGHRDIDDASLRLERAVTSQVAIHRWHECNNRDEPGDRRRPRVWHRHLGASV